jgi:hypothetical protein
MEGKDGGSKAGGRGHMEEWRLGRIDRWRERRINR